MKVPDTPRKVIAPQEGITLMTKRNPATIAVRTGIESDSQYHAVVPPIYLSTNYGFPAFGEVPQYDYTRSGNPNRGLLEKALCDLEEGDGAVITNCGTAYFSPIARLYPSFLDFNFSIFLSVLLFFTSSYPTFSVPAFSNPSPS